LTESELTTTPSGLRYHDELVGGGTEARSGNRVAVHYTGTLESGSKFDSSRDRGTPLEFVLGTGSVIQGWDEGISGMRVGGRRRLVIPAALGYGARGYPPVIPPNSTLVFDVELMEVR
jgi:peptidylprolyl isomerase